MPVIAPVAVVDIGSNSIKALVAARGTERAVIGLWNRTIDARISAGISADHPALGEEGMERGVAAVRDLLADIAPHKPARIVVVATSAVRDAGNGAVFQQRVREATGQVIRILSGDEEARLIGRGLRCDPAVGDLRDYYVFDLGGGSMESLTFRDRRLAQAVSLPLGCVRLTERFVPDPAAPLPQANRTAIRTHVTQALRAAHLAYDLPPRATGVFAGGTMTTVRAIRAARAGTSLKQTSPRIAIEELERLAAEVGRLPLDKRREIPGLPAARADVFPTALETVIAIAGAAHLKAFLHSLHNLRWGLAAEELDALDTR